MRLQPTFSITVLAGLCLSTALWAQDAAAPEDLTLGAPVEDVEAAPAEGSSYVAATHGDWEIRCIRVAEGAVEPCQLYQLLSDAAGNPVAEFNIFDLPDEGELAAGATIVTPLDTLLTPQLRLSIDDGPAQQYPFSFCQPVGCFVRMGLTAADLDALRAGVAANVAIVPLPAPDQVVTLEASLRGFTAGFADLADRTAAQAPAQ